LRQAGSIFPEYLSKFLLGAETMSKRHVHKICFIGLIAFMIFASGCRSAYYKTMETFGKHKRDILVSRVGNARDAQEDAKVQFQTALEKFSSVVKVSNTELKDKYNQLKSELDKSESKAKDVSTRIADVEKVAKDLFAEWKSELGQYTNKNLRQVSEQKYVRTQAKYEQLIGAMKQAEKKIEPVLSAFRDQVLFLKHNLNAQAIASLEGELVSIESNVASLIKDMDASIAEADVFIKSMAAE
jgi:predicted  nucleic acid-binding Zn-ribbon protein